MGIGGTSNGFTIDLAVSKARGNADGNDVTYTNTHVNGGQNVTVISGGDTTLKGGVISGKNVIADIGGDLNIESLQDRSTFESKQKSAGLNASLCIPPFCYGVSTVSGNFAKSNVNGDFLSVQEQSGIKAGDGGFQVSVGGNTDLKGGVLGSSQAAIEQNKNLLVTGSLTASDLINKDEHSASGFSLSGSVSGKLGDQSGTPANLTDAQKLAAKNDGKPGASGGFGSVSGSQASVTGSGISGGLVVITDEAKQEGTGKSAAAVLAGLDRDVTSDSSQNAGALTKGWDAQQLQKDIDAQVAITAKFSTIAPKAIADFANEKAEALKAQGASPDEIAKWGEGGIYRTALHTVSGGLSGGLGGALGAGVVAGAANVLETLQSNAEAALLEQGVGHEAASAFAQALAQATALGIGAAVGGEAGAGTGLATDTNNRQLHPDEKARINKLAGGDPKKEARLTAAACALVKCYAEFAEGSAEYEGLKQAAILGASDAYAFERLQLSKQPGMFGYSTGVFSDASLDAAKAINNTYQVLTRGVGAGQMALGAVGFAGSIATAPAACATGIGCYASGTVAVFSADQAYTGAKQLVYGVPAATYLNQSLQTLGLSPEAAGWMEAALGIGSAAKAVSVANKAINLNEIVKVGGANTGGKTVTLYRVDDAGFAPRIAADGTVPVVTTGSGSERALFVNIGQPLRAQEFALVNRGGNATITAVEVDVSLLEKLRTTAVYDKGAAVKLNPTAPLKVDINKAPDQFGLRTPEQIQWLRDAIKPNTTRIVDPKKLR